MTRFGLSESPTLRSFQGRQVSTLKSEFGLREGNQPRLGKLEEKEVNLEVSSSLSRYLIKIKASKEKNKHSKIRKAYGGRNKALTSGFSYLIKNQAMPEIELVRMVNPLIKMEYKSRISGLEEVFDREGTFDYNALQEIDTIRRFALKDRAFPEKSNDLLKKSNELLINYIEEGFNELQKKIKPNKIPMIEYEREKMRLFYLKIAIEEDDPRSLQELEKENQEIGMKAEELT